MNADTGKIFRRGEDAEARKALGDPAAAQSLAAQSLDVMSGTPAELKARIETESARWAGLVNAKGIRIE